MKYLLPLFLIAAIAVSVPAASAQAAYRDDTGDHVEAGVFAHFFRLNNANTNFEGLGGRAGFNLSPYVQLEAEMGYDFKQSFSETYTGGGTVSVVNSNLRVLDGLIGPKFQTNRGPVRLFFTAKGGFMDFMFDPRSASFNTFASSVENLRASNVDLAAYPGVGAEAFWGPIGFRLDAGDEIYFNHGPQNNLRITFGPSIRF